MGSKMDFNKLAKKIEGYRTIFSISRILRVNQKTAMNYISELRKKGLVETTYSSNKIRRYNIRTVKHPKVGFPGIYDIVNKYSKVKLVPRYEIKVHDHKISIEEAIIRSIKSQEFRLILASLGLFNHVNNWTVLHKLAKKENIERKIGALYELTRKIIRVRKIDKKILKSLMKKGNYLYIIKNFKSKDFKDIERKWKVYLPFNKADLIIYKE